MKENIYLEIVQCKKIYKHLVFKSSFYLWESNSNKVLITPKFNTRWKSEVWNSLRINDGYNVNLYFWRVNEKKQHQQQQFFAGDESIRRLAVKPIETLR